MGVFEAFLQGFASFFSIWQACILQISPFFLACMVGLYFTGAVRDGRWWVGLSRRVLAPALFFAIGFTIFYALLPMTGMVVGRFLSFNQETLGVISGFYILLVSLALLFPRHLFLDAALKNLFVLCALSLFLGVSFALIYSPCITPTLSDIFAMTSRSETALRGGILALFYGLGLCLGLTVTAAALVLVFKMFTATASSANVIRVICGMVLSILALLNITGLMIYYKAFFLGLFVS